MATSVPICFRLCGLFRFNRAGFGDDIRIFLDIVVMSIGRIVAADNRENESLFLQGGEAVNLGRRDDHGQFHGLEDLVFNLLQFGVTVFATVIQPVVDGMVQSAL